MTHHMLTQIEMEELAVLDAWGLLEGEELARFEAAFTALDAAHRGRIRALQNACTEDVHVEVDAPPAQLKTLVLQRIQALRDLEQLHVLDVQPRPRAALTGFFASVGTWRMAALILLAVSITLVVMNRDTSSQYNRLLDEHTLVSALGTIQTDMSPDEQAVFVAMLRRPDVRHAYISSDDGAGFVRIAIDERTGEAFVLAMDLSGRPTPCTLELETAEGLVIELASLRTDRPIDARHLEIDLATLDGGTFRLRDGNGQILGSTLA